MRKATLNVSHYDEVLSGKIHNTNIVQTPKLQPTSFFRNFVIWPTSFCLNMAFTTSPPRVSYCDQCENPS